MLIPCRSFFPGAIFKNCLCRVVCNWTEIIEQDLQDIPNPSVLILGYTHDNKPLHIVVGVDDAKLVLIPTAFHAINAHKFGLLRGVFVIELRAYFISGKLWVTPKIWNNNLNGVSPRYIIAYIAKLLPRCISKPSMDEMGRCLLATLLFLVIRVCVRYTCDEKWRDIWTNTAKYTGTKLSTKH